MVLDEDQKALRETARKFSRERLLPDYQKRVKLNVLDRALLREMGGLGLSQAIINRMDMEIVNALRDPAIAARIRDIGAEAAGLDPQASAAFIDAEIQKWAPLVKVSNAIVN